MEPAIHYLTTVNPRRALCGYEGKEETINVFLQHITCELCVSLAAGIAHQYPRLLKQMAKEGRKVEKVL